MFRHPLRQKRAINESKERLQKLKNEYSQLTSINEKQQRQLDKLFDECAKIIAQVDKEYHQQATPIIEEIFEGDPLFSSLSSSMPIIEEVEEAPFIVAPIPDESIPSQPPIAIKPAFIDISKYENKHGIKKTASKKDFRTSLIGMHNTGSDCFINAALQVIFSDPYDRATIKALPIGHELYFLKDLMESVDKGFKVYTTGIRIWFAKNNPIMRQGQGDSTEALMAIRARLPVLPEGIREEVRVPLEGNTITDFNKLALANDDVYHQAPEQFCFLIGRYQLKSKKVVEKINRPLNFSSAKLELPGTKFRSTNKSVTYYLNAVIMHSGSAKSGHYIAYQKQSDGTWFKFDDGKPVVKVSEANVLKEAAKAYGVMYSQ